MLNNAARVIAKAVGVLGICAIAVGVVMRIAWINDTALKLPAVETHEMKTYRSTVPSCRLPAKTLQVIPLM